MHYLLHRSFELNLIQYSNAEGESVDQGRLLGTLCTLDLMVAVGVGASTCTACRAGTFNDSAGGFSKQGLAFVNLNPHCQWHSTRLLCLLQACLVCWTPKHTKCVFWLQELRFAQCAQQDSLGYLVESDPAFQTCSMMIALISFQSLPRRIRFLSLRSLPQSPAV